MNTDQDMAKAIKLAQAGKLKPAIAILEGLVKAAPSSVAIRYNLALFMLMAGRHAEALPHLDRILATDPRHQPSLFSKAKGLLALDRPDEALPILESLAAGNDAESLLALGNAYRVLNRTAEAAGAFQRLTQVAPGVVGGHLNLCQLLAAGQPETALPALEIAVRLHPKVAELQAMLGQTLLRLGRHDEAIERLKQALGIDPNLAPPKGHLLRAYRETADWEAEEALFTQIRAGLAAAAERRQLAVATQDAIFYPFTGAELRRIATAEAAFRVPGQPRPVLRPQAKAPPPLVVGYLSPDFREHATMHLAGDVFGRHDRAKVRPMAYSVGPDDGSDWRDRLARDCDAFVDLSSMGDRAAAARIAADGVHILVDMSVFTRHARPGIAALRPAPIQAVWLGLAASSGAPWLDYAIVDKILVPDSHEGHFSEKLIRLPHSYQANLAWTPITARPDRRNLGLPEDAVVFCSFNGHRKLDRASFMLWMQVLNAVPGSVLWQLAPPPAAKARLEQAAETAGIDPARLIWAPMLPRPDHLARIPAADLFLDALVCGAHTTAADALRMGVPLITVAGERLASRVAASLLHAVGLPELVMNTPDEFLALASQLGRDRGCLSELRARLSSLLPTAPGFDPTRFARDLEQAYDQIWARHASGKKADNITR
ncbi:peptide transporter [Paramagnetospirillum kuznetsovii]|uniref:protein O-GlcNAc transferase n=1 Tax=Paramagnetospirillum kuznetsovii TaxID=2053833 RepID=A0A364P0B2_9PROT|nr:tetratricopeptide repeat protein [Paramagnetospirillum kuznetsovii]RAU22555.1 peptide transporter [Paramagnetospirillum kuznetsovii]